MRVLHVTSSLDPKAGGPSTALEGLASAQRALGMDVSVVSSWSGSAESPLAASLRANGVDCTLVGPACGRLQRHPELERVLVDAVARADIVHIHAMWEQAQYLATTQARSTGKPYVLRTCGMLSQWSLRSSRLAKRLHLALRGSRMLAAAAAVHCTSETEAADIPRVAPSARVVVVRNGIDAAASAAQPERGRFRAKHLGGFMGPIALCLGRIAHKKNLGFAIDAFAAAGVAGAKLVIVGPGSAADIAALRKRGEAQGLGDALVILDPIYGPERLTALRDATTFLIPSLDENFANALLEAWSVGTSSLSSPYVALAAEGRRFGAGAVLPLVLPEWVTALRSALREPAVFDRQRILDHFAWSGIAAEWRNHYASLVKAGAP